SVWSLGNYDEWMQRVAADAASGIGAPQAAFLLIDYLSNSNPHRREIAAIALKRLVNGISDPVVTRHIDATLWQRLTDSPSVSQAACQALEQVADRLVVLKVASHPLANPILKRTGEGKSDAGVLTQTSSCSARLGWARRCWPGDS